jgi:hypothetical protein
VTKHEKTRVATTITVSVSKRQILLGTGDSLRPELDTIYPVYSRIWMKKQVGFTLHHPLAQTTVRDPPIYQ